MTGVVNQTGAVSGVIGTTVGTPTAGMTAPTTPSGDFAENTFQYTNVGALRIAELWVTSAGSAIDAGSRGRYSSNGSYTATGFAYKPMIYFQALSNYFETSTTLNEDNYSFSGTTVTFGFYIAGWEDHINSANAVQSKRVNILVVGVAS